MKKLSKITFLLCLAACFLLPACKQDNIDFPSQIIGKWKLSSTTINDVAIDLQDCEKEKTIEFQANQICILTETCPGEKTVRSGWSYTSNMLNISVELPVAYYLQVNYNQLELKKTVFDDQGNVLSIKSTYERIK